MLRTIDLKRKDIEGKVDLSGLKKINSIDDLIQQSLINDLNNFKVLHYEENDVYVLVENGVEKAYIQGTEKYESIIQDIEKRYNIDIQEIIEQEKVNIETQNSITEHKQEVVKGVDLPSQNLETLEKLYEDQDFPKQIILDLVKEKLLQTSFSEKIAFLERNKEKGLDLFYYGLVEIIRNVKGKDQARQIISIVGKEKIQKAVKEYIKIDDKFASNYWYYYNSSRFSFTCKGYSISTDACRSVGAYVWALGGGIEGAVDMQSIAFILFDSFGNNIQEFANTIETGIKSYQDVKGKLPSEMGAVFKKEGAIGVMNNLLSKTKMSEGQKEFWTAAAQLGAIVGVIWGLFKIISKNGWKGLAFLVGIELASESLTGQTSIDRLTKLLYGGFDMDDFTKKGIEKGKENKTYANLIGHPSFVNAMMGDKKVEDIKKYCKFENGKIKSFDVEKFMKDLPDDDWRRALLLKLGIKKVEQIFVGGLSGIGLVSETDFNSSNNINKYYKKHLKDIEQRAKQKEAQNTNGSDVSNQNNSGNTNGLGKSDIQEGNASTGGDEPQPVVGNNHSDIEVSNSDGNGEDINTPTMGLPTNSPIQIQKSEESAGSELLDTEPLYNRTKFSFRISPNFNTIFLSKDNGQDYEIDISLERKYLDPNSQARYRLLAEVVKIWSVNAVKVAENMGNGSFVDKEAKRKLYAISDEIVKKLNIAKNSSFVNIEEYEKLVNDIFGKILSVEGGKEYSVDGKKDVIDKDDMEYIKLLLLSGINSQNYESKLLNIFEKMRKGFLGDDGDTTVIGKDLGDIILEKSYKDLGNIVIKLSKKKSKITADEIINLLSKKYQLSQQQKIELLGNIKGLDKKVSKIIENKKHYFTSIYWKLVSENKIDKTKISEDKYLNTYIYNSIFLNLSKYAILDYLIETRGASGEEEKLYSDVKGLGWFDVADENIAFLQEVTITAITSMIPAIGGYAAAKWILVATRLNKIKYLGTGIDVLGTSLGGYAGSVAWESIKDGEWKGNMKGYAEFALFDILFRIAGNIWNIYFKNANIAIKGLAGLTLGSLGVELGVNVPRALEGIELEWNPGNWTKEEIANSILILSTIGISHLNAKKIVFSKSTNGKINIEISEKFKPIKYYRYIKDGKNKGKIYIKQNGKFYNENGRNVTSSLKKENLERIKITIPKNDFKYEQIKNNKNEEFIVGRENGKYYIEKIGGNKIEYTKKSDFIKGLKDKKILKILRQMIVEKKGFKIPEFIKNRKTVDNNTVDNNKEVKVKGEHGIIYNWTFGELTNFLSRGKITLKKVLIEHPSKSWADLKSELGNSYKDAGGDLGKLPTVAVDTFWLPSKHIFIWSKNEILTIFKFVFSRNPNATFGEAIRNFGLGASTLLLLESAQKYLENPSDVTFNHFFESLEAGWDEIIENPKDAIISLFILEQFRIMGLIGDMVYEFGPEGYEYIKDSVGGVQD